MNITLPSRFEVLHGELKDKTRQIFVRCDHDLDQLKLVIAAAEMGGSKICLVLGEPGVGKTTLCHSAAVFFPDKIKDTLIIPPKFELPYAQVVSWLAKHEKPKEGMTLILFDGREKHDNQAELNSFVTDLNQFLRKNAGYILLWPTTDKAWLQEIYAAVTKVSGHYLFAENPYIEVRGPDKKEWIGVLDKLLSAKGLTRAYLGITTEMCEDHRRNSKCLGEFIEAIGNHISKNIAAKIKTTELPELIFVFSGADALYTQANSLRRGDDFVLEGNKLLQYSAKSRAGRHWHARAKEGISLPVWISQLNAKLLILTQSAFVYSILQFDAKLRDKFKKNLTFSVSNATRAVESNEFFRFLNNRDQPNLTSGKKGATSTETTKVYDKLQELSKEDHRTINEYILRAMRISPEESAFERALGNGNVRCDYLHRTPSKTMAFEFHYISVKNSNANHMSQYILNKLKEYADAFNVK